MNTHKHLPTIAAITLVFFSGCKKEFDVPPVKHINEGARMSILEIKNRYDARKVYRFKGDTSLYCIVIADEVSGNLYKDIYVRDASGSMHVKLTDAGGLFIGDSLRINLNAVLLNNYSELIQLDSVNPEKNVVKLASGLVPKPESVVLSQLTVTPGVRNRLQSALVKLDALEFMPENRDQPYGDVNTKAALQYTLQDCEGRQVLLRTSGYAYFANRHTPSGNGSLVAIASQFNGSFQLILRSADEVNMENALCSISTPTLNTGTTYLSKNFEDGSISSGGWTNVNQSGNVNWVVKTATTSSGRFAECNNYIGPGNQPACETWLISPSVDLRQSAAPGFSFTSASLFTGPPLQVVVSDDYVNGLPASATWSALTVTLATGSSQTPSGTIDLSAWKKQNVRIGFKYSGNLGSGQRWQLDNIRLDE